VFVLVASIVVGLLIFLRLRVGYPRPKRRYVAIGIGDAAFLRAAAQTFFPADGAIALSGDDVDLPGYADRYLAQLPRRQRRLVRALFLLFEHATLVFPARGVGAFRRFSALSPEQRTAVLRAWSESGFYLRRTAFTALKAILIMGYMGDSECLRRLGLEPFEIESPVCEADLLYPLVGQHPAAIRYDRDALTPPGEGGPLRSWDGPAR